VSYTSRILRAAWTANRVERAVRNPTRYAKNRAKSNALSAIGFWSLFRRFWQA
jgi:hypothetical protein